jgi:3-hydroxyisobutyrate dehydrogenase-like beta-hydroxyacid dehydrogenase
VLAVEMCGVAEGLSLGQKLGLDVRVLSEIFNTSTARCWASDSYNPVPGACGSQGLGFRV